MADNEEKKGPSKKELKKMAKKAEKSAKKEDVKAGGGGAAGPTPTANVSAVVPPPPAPKLLLFQGSADGCSATLKVAFASQAFGVDVGVASKRNVPDGVSGKAPTLCYGSELLVLGSGGNAMAKAIALMADNSKSTSNHHAHSGMLLAQADEWCEFEHASMRHADDKAFLKALETSLGPALETSSTGIYLVGEKLTVADICVVVTLSQHAKDTSAWPVSVQKYYKAHSEALEKANSKVPQICPVPPIDVATNPSLQAVTAHIFMTAFEEVFPASADDIPSTLMSKCQNPKHGDYQCTAAMPIFAAMKKMGALPADINSPQQVAQAVVAHLQKDTTSKIVEDLQVQGPGFIMCRLTPSYLQTHMQRLLETQQLPKPLSTSGSDKQPGQCLVDFSSPNIAKEMHVGHLRSTIIGEAVCRILEFAGHNVHRVNHVGDWGTQFGMLIEYLQVEYPDFSSNMPNITDLTGFYKAAKQRFDDDPDFKQKSQLNVVKLQSGDAACLEIWNLLCDISRREFEKVYKRLDVTVYECGESFYNDKIQPVIEEFEKAGLISVEEGGAKCVFITDPKDSSKRIFNIPLMLQKSDGGFGYDSTDMAALKHRLFTLGVHRTIYITDFTQGDHFQMCFAAARMIGWVPQKEDEGPDSPKLQHIGFGTVQGEDGKRFKTRSGDTVRLVDLLDEAVSRMEASLRERIAEGRANITEEEVHEVAEAIGYGAVKYFDLRRNPTTNYKFSYDGMLDTKGNTAVYLLYARVRLESIAAKAKAEQNVDVEELIRDGSTKIELTHASERNLALVLQTFTDVLALTLDDLYPYHICEFVYSVAIAASDFVTQCRVLGSPEMKSRLLLCHITTLTMRQCFDLLGIRHVKRI